MSNSTIATIVTAAGLVLSVACAQEPTELPSEPVVAVSGIDAAQLTPGQWTYEHFDLDMEGRRPERPVRTTIHALAEATYEGLPAWRSVTVRNLQYGHVKFDTAYVTKSNLMPLYQILHGRPGEGAGRQVFISRSFASGGVVEKATLADGRDVDTAFALPTSDSPQLVDVEHLMLLLRLVPLSSSWSGSVPFVRWLAVPRPLVPVGLRVVGEETVTLPIGTYDCWILDLRGQLTETWWVDKQNRWVVKRHRKIGAGVVREIVLTAWEYPF